MSKSISQLKNNTGRILSYNFYCRPRMFFWDNQIKRAKKVEKMIEDYEKINPKLDVIMFQEIYDNKAYKILKQQMKNLGFIFRTKRKKNFMRLNDGLVTFSRYPIKEFEHINFRKNSLVTNRGCVYSKILIRDRAYHIVNLHLDTFSVENRKMQMEDIKRKLDEKDITNDDVTLIGGDFNINFYKDEINNVDQSFEEEFEFPDFIANKKEEWTNWTSYNKNPWILRRDVDENEKSEFIDYFIYRGQKVKLCNMKVVRFMHPQFCNDILFSTNFYFNFYNPMKKLKITDMSDHYAVLCNVF
jgi:endonuclease/exonuclease/phosphatase family metal-dependent hydrolase